MANSIADHLLSQRDTDRYVKGDNIGEGTYGVVYKAVDKKTNRTVAVKKIRLGDYKEGVNMTALREIKLLKELNHPNIIELIDAYLHKRNLHLVFEFMETELEAVIKNKNIVLSPADIKSYMLMTLKGLAFCHKKWVLHRDMKPNNLLIGADGQLKLADFGLARIYGSPDRKFTHQVFARWYRAPELLYGTKQYGPAVDVWAAGCIFAELLLRRPFLQGQTDMDQLGKIFAAFGTPNPSQWQDVTFLPDYIEYQHVPPQPWRALFPMASEDALDLLSKMFTYDPNARVSAQQALDHRYFSSVPLPTKPALLPRPASKVEPRNPARPAERNSPGPIVLSPPNKVRRISHPPGGHAGNPHSLGLAEKHVKETPNLPTGMPMSIDTNGGFGSSFSSRPKLSSSDRSHLRRKLDLDLAEHSIQEEQVD
ncbi:unnamed protein product [Victoria cruziana]